MTTRARACVAGAVVCLLFGTSQMAIAQESRWMLMSANGQTDVAEAWLDFNEDGTFDGNNGCNAYQGAGRFEGNGLFIEGPVATTPMVCPDPGLTAQEAMIMRVMGGGFVATRYDPLSHTLSLIRDNDRLDFKRQDVSTPQAGASDALPWPTLFDVDYLSVFGLSGPLNIREAASTESPRVARVLAGALLRSDGCERQTDRIWCAVGLLDGSGSKGWAAGDFLQPAPALLRASREVFDTIGTLDCSAENMPGSTRCDFGVARDGESSAVVTVYEADRDRMNLHFAGTELLYVDDPGGAVTLDATARKQKGAVAVTIRATVYVLPIALLTGAP